MFKLWLTKIDAKTATALVFLSSLAPFSMAQMSFNGFYEFFSEHSIFPYFSNLVCSLVFLCYFLSFCVILDYVASNLIKSTSKLRHVISGMGLVILISSLLYYMHLFSISYLLYSVFLSSSLSFQFAAVLSYVLFFLFLIILFVVCLKTVKEIYETGYLMAFFTLLVTGVIVGILMGIGNFVGGGFALALIR